MLLTLAGAYTSRDAKIALELDLALFDADSWFALGTDNRRVAGVPVTSLTQGLSLIDEGGRVASVVGRLRPQYRAVDIDVDGVEGDAITNNVAKWCENTGLWHLVRPSGGAPGRHHIIVAIGQHEDALDGYLSELRTRYRTAKTRIDLRSALRPLSAPHRQGGCPKPYGKLASALVALRSAGGDVVTPAVTKRKTRKGSRRRHIEPMTPQRSYTYRPLSDKWATYLATGQRPAWKREGDPAVDSSNSTWELMCTAEMVRSGWDHVRAWATIQAAHPSAMSRAKADYQRWVAGVWNAAVKADDEFQPVAQTSKEILQATQEAADRLRAFAWTIPVRERPALLVVAGVLLRRMERENTLRVPCPERDLVLDTGIKDRKTIRKQLNRLNGVLGTRDTTTFEMSRKADSSYEFEIPACSGVVRDIPPPSFHTPLPTALPQVLPLRAYLLLIHLDPAQPRTPQELALLSQSVPLPSVGLSSWARRQLRSDLSLLQKLDLAVVTPDGTWTRSSSLRTQDDYAELRQLIEAERATFRESAKEWLLQRRQAVAATQQRALIWWSKMSEHEQAERLCDLSAQFRESSVLEQHELKRTLARRDLRRGIDLDERRVLWEESFSAEEFEERRVSRSAWWRSLPHPLQVAYASAWQRHRDEFSSDEGRGQKDGNEQLPEARSRVALRGAKPTVDGGGKNHAG